MSKTLVFVEHTGGKVKRSALELLSAAQKSGNPIVALSLGVGSADFTADLQKYGATEFLVAKDPVYGAYNPELFTAALVEAIKLSGATLVLASASSTGKDLFPRVAARLDVGIISDATEISFADKHVTVKKPFYSGKALVKMGFESSPIQIILMRPNQLPIVESPATLATQDFAPTIPSLKTIVKEVVKGATEKLDLTEANIIVAGGRGLKEASNFKLLSDLADTLGATVGASRAVVDAGWVSHGMQVGQTGKTVAPSLYIAVGISGAIQHLAGMSGSKVVVAINSDANAPIFQKATYGIVGDALEILPKLTEEFKRALQ